MINFPMLTFEDANPWITGAKKGQELYQGFVQNRYAQPMAEQALQEALYKNQIAQAKARYAMPMEEANLQEQQMKSPHIQAMIDEIYKGTIPQQQATTGHLNAETKYMPLKMAIESANAMRQNSRFGDAYQFGRIIQSLPIEQREAYISEHPDEYQNLLNTMGNKALQAQMGQQQDILSNVVGKYFPAAQQQVQQQVPQQQLYQVAQQPLAQSQFSNDSEKAERTADAFKLAADYKLIGSQQKRRANAAVTLEKFLDNDRPRYARMINNATKFAGLVGKLGSIEAAASQASPQEYTDYREFKTQFVPNLKSQLRMQESLGADQETAKTLEDMFSAGLDIDQNPEGAKRMINDSIRMAQKIGDSVFEGAEPLHKGIHRKMFGLKKLDGDYTDLKSSDIKSDWISRAKTKNPGVSEEELSAYYDKHKSGK